MSGLKLVIPNFTSNNASLPILREDKRLTAGSLLLVDFSHPFLTDIAIPINSSTFKNIAYKEAMSVLNTTVEANVTPSAVNTLTQTGGKAEFTSKRGLHVIVSQTSDIGDGNDFIIKLPNAILDHMRNNIARGFYISVWNKTTRMFTGTPVSSDMVIAFTNSNNFLASLEQQGWLGSNNTGKNSEPAVLNATKRNTIAINAAAGTPATGNTSNNTGYIFAGFTPYDSFERNKKASKILYQLHIIDLTTAGLTFAQADALDLANYTQAFGVGGRFENDTFTSPSTLA